MKSEKYYLFIFIYLFLFIYLFIYFIYLSNCFKIMSVCKSKEKMKITDFFWNIFFEEGHKSWVISFRKGWLEDPDPTTG